MSDQQRKWPGEDEAAAKFCAALTAHGSVSFDQAAELVGPMFVVEGEIKPSLMAVVRESSRANGKQLVRSDDRRMYWLGDYEEEGFAEGKKWARETANPSQLSRLSKTMRQVYDDWTEIVAKNPNRSHAQQLAFVILDKFKFEPNSESPEPDAADAAQFWDGLGIGDIEQIPHEEWVRGFVDGALQVGRLERRL